MTTFLTIYLFIGIVLVCYAALFEDGPRMERVPLATLILLWPMVVAIWLYDRMRR